MEHVILDETYKLAIGFEKSKNQYMTEIKESIRKQTGIDAENIETCVGGTSNITVKECPISSGKNIDKSEFIVAVHNQQSKPFTKLVRIPLPSQRYKAQVWSNSLKQYVKVEQDIMEQKH